MSDIASLWNELEELLATIAPTVLPTLNPPATDCDLDLLESKTGLILPQDFRQSLEMCIRDSYEGDYLCIDLTPGSYGSIHLHIHDSTIERDIAATYTVWLSNTRDVFRDRRFDDLQGFIDFWSFDTTT